MHYSGQVHNRMTMKTSYCILITGIMFSATLSCGRNTGNHPVTPSIDVPSGLSQEDSIAYIENERYKDVTVTAEDLLVHRLQSESA